MSEIGTNAIFQYDDVDGYRYVVFDLWKVIAYRVRICKSTTKVSSDNCSQFIKLFLYYIDGSRAETAFGICYNGTAEKSIFSLVEPQNITTDIWKPFVNRIEMTISTMVFSINTLKKEVDKLSQKLQQYDCGKIDVALLLGFEERDIIAVYGKIEMQKKGSKSA